MNVIFQTQPIGFHGTLPPPMHESLLTMFKTFPHTAIQISLKHGAENLFDSYTIDDLLITRKLILDNPLFYMFIHGDVTYNTCGPSKLSVDDPKYTIRVKRMIDDISRELDIGVMLDCGVVLHFGSRPSKDEGRVLMAENISKALLHVNKHTQKYATAMGLTIEDFISLRRVVLENSAGEGNKLGESINDFYDILQLVDNEIWYRIDYCTDTAHAFGSGQYHFGRMKSVKLFFEHLDTLEENTRKNVLRIIHLNDSKKSTDKKSDAPFGSKKDRHASIGDGYIFDKKSKNALRYLIEQCKERDITLIGEPPTGGIEKSWTEIYKYV